MKTIRNIIIAVIIILIVIAGYIVWPRYDELSLSPRMHSYEDAAKYARSIDYGSVVSEEYTDETIDGHVYRIWPAVIYGKECKVASVPEERAATSVLPSLTAVFRKDFYRLDSNYDYIVVGEALKEHPELGEVFSSEFGRTVISRRTMDSISDEELEKLNASYNDVMKKMPHTSKPYSAQILVGDHEILLTPIFFEEEESEGTTDKEYSTDVSWEMPEETSYNGDNSYLAYTKVLKAYETGIKGYGFQKDNDRKKINDDSKTRAVAITDIDGDSNPELLFMCAALYPYKADLIIYRYDPEMKAAVKCEYSTDEHDGEPQAFSDMELDGGRSIMIYKGSNPNTLYLLYEQASGHMTAYAGKFLCEGNELEREWYVMNSYDPSIEDDDEYDIYYIDGVEVSSDKGMELFRKANEDYGELILFSGNTDTISAFSHDETDEPLAMTFDQAVRWLSDQN